MLGRQQSGGTAGGEAVVETGAGRNDVGGGSMKTRAAILWEVGKDWSVEEIDLDPPKAGEVLDKLVGSGLCHSDEHLVTGDLPFELPIIGGHEGAGVVEE